MIFASLPDRPSELSVLLVAEHASLQFGGEAALPLHYFRVLRKRCKKVHLITHARVRNELERQFPDDQSSITYIEDSPFAIAMWKLGSRIPARLSYFTFGMASRLVTQWQARKFAREILRSPGHWLVHQPIPVSPKEPSLLVGLDRPLVVGPMNGGMEFPEFSQKQQSAWGRGAVAWGRRMADMINRLIPGKHEASTLLVANERTALALPSGVRGKVVTLVENGVDLELWSGHENREFSIASGKGNVCRFVFVGRLVDWKALDIVIDAFAGMKESRNAELHVVGDGPMRAVWEQQAKVACERSVIFHGWKAQADCANFLKTCSALVLPSLFECGGAVVLEAMAMGLPVIATKWGGPADYLDDSCGVLVPPIGRAEMVKRFASAMDDFVTDPSRRHAMGQAGRRRIELEYDWEKKVDAILDIYMDTLNRYYINP